jgi:hypothetical protein
MTPLPTDIDYSAVMPTFAVKQVAAAIAQVAQLEAHMPNLSLQPNFESDVNMADR